MRSDSLQELELALSELEKYIEYNQTCNKIISVAEGENDLSPTSLKDLIDISNTFRRKKIFEYNSYIISLYGLFERFIENIIEEYLNEVCTILDNYSDFPEQIINNNLELNVDILRNIKNPKFQNISEKDIIKNIHNALNENKPILNIDAFKYHPYNFKQSIISDFFGNVGIQGISGKLKIYHPLKELLNDKYGNTANITSDVLFNVIDDLSQRRNDVAHGVENIELLNVSIIKEYLIYISSYCNSLYNVLQNESLELLYKEKPNNIDLVRVINHSIIIVKLENITFSKTDFVLIEKADSNHPKYVLSRIDDIQINKVSHDKLIITDKKLVGIKLDEYCKDNYNFKIITVPNNV